MSTISFTPKISDSAEQIIKRCLKCKNARCSAACPVRTPIPEVVRLCEEGKRDEAARLLFANNPMSAVTSIICPHERNCNGHCVRGLKGEPVAFFKIEQEISTEYISNFEPPEIEKNGHKIAVIGAGPAGLTASILLSLKGFSVTLIDSRDRIGGVLTSGIPDFRLPRELVMKYEDILYKLGVKFKPNTFIGSNVTLNDMFIDGYEAIFIAVGTPKPNKLGLLGETLGNAHYAIDFLKSPSSYRLGDKVVVIGAGNVALDAARMAVRNMPEGGSVTMINNRRECDMTGNIHEINDAAEEGIKFRHELQTIKINEDSVRFVKVIPTVEGDKVIYEEDFSQIIELPATTVILAIGQGPQGAVVSESNVQKTKRGLLEADEHGRTNIPGVYAAGDVVSGPKTVVEAVAFSKATVDQIEEYVLNKK